LRIPLSSVDLHPVEVGKAAASILLGMIDDKPAPRKPVFVEPTFIVRASTRRSPSL
jgi:DNA-binding LacI/PurR family transcriptional regulator